MILFFALFRFECSKITFALADEESNVNYIYSADSTSGPLVIGTDSDSNEEANAIKGGIKNCPTILRIPGEIIYNGQRRSIEAIGRFAFNLCGYKGRYGNTEKIVVPWQVKIIKYFGLGNMFDVTSFHIEAGSKLTTLEETSIHCIGLFSYNDSLTKTLSLPASLENVADLSIHECNLFNEIIYCGRKPIESKCLLEKNRVEVKVRVTKRYPQGRGIFGRKAYTDRLDYTEDACNRLSYLPPNNCRSSPPQRFRCAILTPSCSIFSFPEDNSSFSN